MPPILSIVAPLKVSVTQSCLTLCDPVDCSPQGSSVHGILHARILEWVAISYSWGSSRPWAQTQVSWIAGGFFTTEPARKPSGNLSSVFKMILWLCPVACGILFPNQVLNAHPLLWKCRVLTTGPSGKSLWCIFEAWWSLCYFLEGCV